MWRGPSEPAGDRSLLGDSCDPATLVALRDSEDLATIVQEQLLCSPEELSAYQVMGGSALPGVVGRGSRGFPGQGDPREMSQFGNACRSLSTPSSLT